MPKKSQLVRKLDSGRWQGRVPYRDPDTGKRRELGKTFATAQEADVWVQSQRAQFREDPTHRPPSDQSLEMFFTEWLQIIAGQGLSESTLTDYRYMAAHPIRVLGSKPLNSLSTLDIQRLYTTLATDHSPRTVQYVHVVLKKALNDAVAWGLIAANPAAKAKPPRQQRRLVTVPTPEEARRLLEAAQGGRWYAMWVWMLHTGMREGEVLALRWSDLDWGQKTVRVAQALSQDGSRRLIKEPKTDRSIRVIALSDEVLAVMRTHQTQQARDQARAGEKWSNTGLVFATQHGKLLSKRNTLRALKADLQRAGLPSTVRVHSLRHAMATHWLAASVSIRVVSERLGHTSIAFTLQTYGHVLPHQQGDAAEQMSALLLPKPSTDHPQKPFHPGLSQATPETGTPYPSGITEL